MSYRGRGGGRFGGRGRGRFGGGRFRSYPILQKDEFGNFKKPDPPQLFPDLKKELPSFPEISEMDTYMVGKRRHLLSLWNNSPYFIEPPNKKAKAGLAAEIERYSDKYKPRNNLNRPPLSSYLKLAQSYFPAELLTQGSKRVREVKGSELWVSQADGSKYDLQRLERLENLEQKAEARLEKTGGKESEKKEGEEDDDENEEVEEEEEDLEDDDYNQNFGFDDDDDYLDMDEGEDEGPVY